MLEGESITVRLGGRTIVDGLSFTLREGQWLMLVGPNGAGKSTLLRAVSQTLPYTGRVLLRGQDARRMKSAQLARTIGVLAQQHSAEYAFTVEEVVTLGRYAYTSGPLSRGDSEGAARIEEALRVTGLTCSRSPAASFSARFWRRYLRRTRTSCCSTSPPTTSTSPTRSTSSPSSANG